MLDLRVIGVTGGIGSGKSTVSKILFELGAQVIDADVIARDIIRKGQRAYNDIIDYFGAGILDKNKEIDRKKLAAEVFNNKEKIEALNSITHKSVARVIIEKLEDFKKKYETIVIDAPIPIEHGFLDIANEVWVVVSDREKRIERVMKRSGLTYDEVVERINAQLSDDHYSGLADLIIRNDGTYEELEKNIKRTLSRLNN